MIEIEITKSVDIDFLGKWQFHKNNIYIGYPLADVAYPPIDLSYAFLIEVLPEAIQVIPHPKLEFWLLNSKRSTQQRTIKIGDSLKVGDLEFKITQAQFEETFSKKTVLDERLKDLVKTEDESLMLISLINKKVKSSENIQ